MILELVFLVNFVVSWKYESGNILKQANGIYNTSVGPTIPGGRGGAIGVPFDDFFIFGYGKGYDENSNNIVYLNDLWKYNFTSKKYTFINGNKKINPSEPAAPQCTRSYLLPKDNALPGGRFYSVTIKYDDNSFFIFGGSGCDDVHPQELELGDLYLYHVDENRFDFLNSHSAIQATNPEPHQFYFRDFDSNQYPAARFHSAGVLLNNNNFVICCGVGNTYVPEQAYFNDVWMFRIGIEKWAWYSGSLLHGVSGKYGEKFVFSAENVMGGRKSVLMFLPPKHDDKVLFFGGFTYFNSKHIYVSDLWEWDIESDMYRWIGGMSTPDGSAHVYDQAIKSFQWMDPRVDYGFTSVDGNTRFFFHGGSGHPYNLETGDFGGKEIILADFWELNCKIYPYCFFHKHEISHSFDDHNIKRDFSKEIVGSRKNQVLIAHKGDLYIFSGVLYEDAIRPYVSDMWVKKVPEEPARADYFTIFLYISIPILVVIFMLFAVGLVFLLVFLVFFSINRMRKGAEKTEITKLIRSKSNHDSARKNKTLRDSMRMDEASQKEIEMFEKVFLTGDQKFLEFKKSLFKDHSFLERLCRIDYNDIKLSTFLGAGGSGANVFRGTYTKKTTAENPSKSKLEIAFKSFPLKTGYNSDDFSEFQKEMAIFFSCDHKNVLSLHGVVLQPKHCGLVLEYCSNGDLHSYLKKNPQLTFPERLEIVHKIARGMNYLHFNNIIHRDLKTENVLIDADLEPKIMDFGISRVLSRTISMKTMNIGTQSYQAPELVVGSGKYSRKIDVFSFSMLAYVVLTGLSSPFPEENKYSEGNVTVKLATDASYRPDLGKIAGGKKGEYVWVKDMLSRCWDHSPANRYHFYEICNEFTKRMLKNAQQKDIMLITKPPPITVYMKILSEDNSSAEDFEMKKYTMEEVTLFVHEKYGKDKKIKEITIASTKKVLVSDEDLLKLEEDSILSVEFI